MQTDAQMSNLVKNSERTPDERRELAIRAGRASGASRARKKLMKERLIELLSLPMKPGRLSGKMVSLAGYKDANVTVEERIVLAMATKAAKGDVKAAEFIRDTIGEAPVQEMRVEQSAAASMTDEQLMKIASGEA